MSNLNFQLSNVLIDNKLEYYDSDYNFWTKAEFSGINGEKEYKIRINREMNEQLLNTNEEKLRIVHLQNLEVEERENSSISSFEYSIKPGSYIPCEILDKKGKFYSVKIKSDNNMALTKIVREKEIRKITCVKFSEILNEIYGNISIEIPFDLKNWTESESFSDLINNLTQDFSTCYFSTYENSVSNHNYIRIFSEKQHLTTIQLMIEVAIQNELKLLKFESDKNSTLLKLHSVKKELDKKKKFYISKELVGLLIGSKGANINRLKQKYEVNIAIQTEIAGEDALVTITGENEKYVEDCVKETKFVKKSFELNSNVENKVKQMIPELIQKSGLIKMFITRDKYKDEKRGVYYLTYLNLIGTEQSLEEALKSKELNQFIII